MIGWDDPEEFDWTADNVFLWVIAGAIVFCALILLGVYSVGYQSGFQDSETEWVVFTAETHDSLNATRERWNSLQTEWEALEPFCTSCKIRDTYTWQPGDSLFVTALCAGSMQVDK